jgi:hypothetical protein
VIVGATPTFNAGEDYDTYQWYWNGGLIDEATASTYTLTGDEKAGIYELSVVVSDSAGEELSARCRVTITAK